MNDLVCPICGNTTDNKVFAAREMMFGMQDEFQYLECGNCKLLKLKELPADMARYYPEDYYSYYNKGEDHHIQRSFSKKLKRNLKASLLNQYLQGSSFIGRMLAPKFRSYYPWIKPNMLTSRSNILDVGCGAGELLLKMYNDGFRKLAGLDPYIKADIHYKCGITIHKKTLDQLDEKYDLIMMHHAFEHMDEPLSIVRRLHEMLNPGGMVLIRIPVADCFAWHKYGVNWVQLDAPRHIFLHTVKSMQMLCDQSGFKLSDVVFDSWSLQFYGSELYIDDIPLREGEEKQLFSPRELETFNAEAAKLNEQGQGDQACFYLSRI